MRLQARENNTDEVKAPGFIPERPVAMTTHLLSERERVEALRFLGQRPSHTFGLAGFILNNGMESPLNRGSFYACRGEQGEMVGLALIGHATLFETESEQAIEAFARIAQSCLNIHMLWGEQEKVESFWSYYSEHGQQLRCFCRELLFEQSSPLEGLEEVAGLRQATPDDLDAIVPVHALTALEESGVDPLLTDPEGFRNRCARRIEQGRTWVWIEDGKVIFKAECQTESPEIVYLEGIWMSPEKRGNGLGLRCMTQLTRALLERTRNICLLVNEENRVALNFYDRAGYRLTGHYDTIFLKRQVH
ncbi:MAG TPA: GNAT family N-acetyltransferase [Blastocatellia bacterium]|jgi:predicted GNAT family acetyltransferase|nr:GNAT family N-acetyltransferase [Blastocatellia bacterium]